VKDKVAIEKSRISQRVGHEARMHQANAPETSAGLTSCVADGAGYLGTADRFHSDTAGEEFELRQDAIMRRKAATEFRRNQAAKREEDRWSEADTKIRKEEEFWQKAREEGTKSRKNKSDVAYDVVTLQYDQNVQGEQQKHSDDLVRYRAAVRARNLVLQGDSRYVNSILSSSLPFMTH